MWHGRLKSIEKFEMMLSNFKNLVKLTSQVIRKCELQSICQNRKLLSAISCDLCNKTQRQNFHSDTPRMIKRNVLEVRKAAKYDSKRVGRIDIVHGINEALKRKEGFFPTGDLSNTVIDGMVYKDIPVVYVTATKNNTIMTLVDKGLSKLHRSCGMEGFKNSRKGTNVAAQALGTAFSYRALKNGYKTIRVVVKGLGPGRLSALKGLQVGGMSVVSITDNTMNETTLRPRKQRRV